MKHAESSMTRNPVYTRPLTTLAAEFFLAHPSCHHRPTALRGYMRENPQAWAAFQQWAATVLHANVANDQAAHWTLLDRIGQVESLRQRKAAAERHMDRGTLAAAVDTCRLLTTAVKQLAAANRKLTAGERRNLRKIGELVIRLHSGMD